MTYTILDTETTGFFLNAPNDDKKQPHIVQLAAILTDDNGVEKGAIDVIINTRGLHIPSHASAIHGIIDADLVEFGVHPKIAVLMFKNLLAQTDTLIAHNAAYDIRAMEVAEARYFGDKESMFDIYKDDFKVFDTMTNTTNICCIKHKGNRGGYKWPKLEELYEFLFKKKMANAHNAMADVRATAKCFFELKKRGLIDENKGSI